MLISSHKNPRIKSLLELGKARERQGRKQFALEGAREIERAIACGYKLSEIFYCTEILSEMARNIIVSLGGDLPRYEVTTSVYAKIAVRESSDGLVALFQQKEHDLVNLPGRQMSLMLAVQGVEKPGNLGALLRSADGAGVDCVFLVDQQVDLYNPLALRASVGAAFNLPIISISSVQLKRLAQEKGWQIVAAALSPQATTYSDVNLSIPSVVLLGSEADGLSENWLTEADAVVQIPMFGIADSLNVSVAGAVLLYEARRQSRQSITGRQ